MQKCLGCLGWGRCPKYSGPRHPHRRSIGVPGFPTLLLLFKWLNTYILKVLNRSKVHLKTFYSEPYVIYYISVTWAIPKKWTISRQFLLSLIGHKIFWALHYTLIISKTLISTHKFRVARCSVRKVLLFLHIVWILSGSCKGSRHSIQLISV